MDDVFKANPSVHVLYVFEDGNAFISKKHAEDYKVMKGKDYKEVSRNAKKEEAVVVESKEVKEEEVKTEQVEAEKEPRNKKGKRKNK